MNFKSIYDGAITPKETKEERKAEKDASFLEQAQEDNIAQQGYQEWVNHPITQKLIAHMAKIGVDAMIIAQENPFDSNITAQSLIKTKQLEELINYVKTGN